MTPLEYYRIELAKGWTKIDRTKRGFGAITRESVRLARIRFSERAAKANNGR